MQCIPTLPKGICRDPVSGMAKGGAAVPSTSPAVWFLRLLGAAG